MKTLRPWERPYAQRFEGRKPKIMLGLIAFGDVYAEIWESTLVWALNVGKRYADTFEIYASIATRREQYRARNYLVDQAMEGEMDFLVMIDDDHTLSDCPEMLGAFYRAEKPFQGALYVQRRSDELQPVIQLYDKKTGDCYWANWSHVPRESGPVDILGGGLNWYDMTIFDFMGKPFYWPYPQDERRVYFKPHPKYGLDMQFSIRVKEELGIDPWLNMDVQVGHVSYERSVIRPPSMKAHKICDACETIIHWANGEWRCETCQKRAA